MSDATALEAAQLQLDAAALGVMLDAATAAAQLRLLDELQHWNRAYNLSAIRDRHDMIRLHLLDSLAALPALCGTRVADVGTGAGFPGLPLALACPQRQFVLIDSNGKKVRFVAHAARALGLGHVTARHARAAAAAADGPFDTVIARAFAALPDLLREVAPLCGPDSCVLALKGRYPQDELQRLPPDWALAQVWVPAIPGLDAERHILKFVPRPAPARPV